MTPERLANKLASKEYRKARAGAYKAMGDAMVDVASQEAPRSDQQGEHLADHLRAVISNTDHPIRVTAEDEYLDLLGWVVKGTPPHVIEATNAQALHWQVGGTDFFAKSVNHPGTQPNDFLERAAERSADTVADIQAQAAQAWLDRVAAE
jgi:hypothetical protein